jgi:hypothetical protein
MLTGQEEEMAGADAEMTYAGTAYVSIRQHTSAYVSILAYVC